jgi:hypothetical protein
MSICLLTIWFSQASLRADTVTKKMKTIVRSEGSVPPVRVLFACVHELDDQPFSDPQIKDCAGKLGANHFIRDVKVNTREIDERSVSVEFILSGQSLPLDEFTIETFDKQHDDIVKFLSLNDRNLHVGVPYTWVDEFSTAEGIKQFYRAQGTLVAVVPKLRLDYKQGKARINFKVIQGPTVLPHPLVPPYGKACSDHTSFISWYETDNGVPVELIESGLALASPFTCFSDELAERDKAYLSKLNLLSKSSVDYSGPVGDRHIQYKLKARPLKVAQINIRGFGDAPSNLEDSDPTLLKNIALKTGDFFSHWAATDSANYLKKTFSKDGHAAEVTVQEELSETDALKVTFSVLVFPLQTNIVDGHEIK